MVVFTNSCKKSDEQKLADECCDGSIDSLLINTKQIDKSKVKDSVDLIKWKSDSTKYFKIVEYVGTEKPKCNTFRDIYALKIKLADTIILKEISEFLLEQNKQVELNECEFSNFRDIFIFKNKKSALKNEGDWIVSNSPGEGFYYADYNNK